MAEDKAKLPVKNGKTKTIQEGLKEKVLKEAEQKKISSKKFEKIEAKVVASLKKQNTDEALNAITIGALVLGSSDIHFEVFENDVHLRFRIDGILVDIFVLNIKDYNKILERIKYSSNLKLNITTIPQDGKYSLNIEGKKLDIRVSTLPTKYGENVVCRVLDSSKNILNFEDLGFFWTGKRIVEKAIEKKNGMILVTGPTGSGKTTTLYTIINKLNTPDKKIITLEDPIEYEMPGIIQSEVEEKDGFDFRVGLKALLRQDPDVIMVGEIRDGETLETATTASLTGHLLLSTLHTKSAAETLDRLINMGMKSYIIASSLDTIIAQRLVRKICPHCKKEKEKTSAETQIIRSIMDEIGMPTLGADTIKLYQGAGCEKCNNSGYKGRIGIYEILRLNEEIRNLIRE